MDMRQNRANTALGKCFFFILVGDPAEARKWARELVRILENLGVLESREAIQ